MNGDIRQTEAYRAAESLARDWYHASAGDLIGLEEPALSPCGGKLAAIGVFPVSVSSPSVSRVLIIIDLLTSGVSIVTGAERRAFCPCWSPAGDTLAYLSRGPDGGDGQLCLIRPGSADPDIAAINGAPEQVDWSPDGQRLLVLVAGAGADEAGALGGRSGRSADAGSDGLPDVAGSRDEPGRRSLLLFDRAGLAQSEVAAMGLNIWEAAWSGPGRVVAICSEGAAESDWYRSDLVAIDLADGGVEQLYSPRDQIGWLAVSPDGQKAALIEAVCSDRLVLCGELRCVDLLSKTVSAPDPEGHDVSQVQWSGPEALLLTVHQSVRVAIVCISLSDQPPLVCWQGAKGTIAGLQHARIASGSRPGQIVFVTEGWFRAPELVRLGPGGASTIMTLGDPDVAARVLSEGEDYVVSWRGSDGLELEGWLLVPSGAEPPYAVIMEIHGGPVAMSRPAYLAGRLEFRLLLQAGIALFFPNPRGSTGRGQAFARQVVGDMGGRDADDLLSGLDMLVSGGLADPGRLGVTGGSYGGFMTCLLIGRDNRFRAAAAICPVTDWFSQTLTCNIPAFCEIFLGGSLQDAAADYFDRSPIRTAHKVSVPVLLVAGGLDRSTPPGQALEFHNAVRLGGGLSQLVTYPCEGHRPRRLPAMIDHAARMRLWFGTHLLGELDVT